MNDAGWKKPRGVTVLVDNDSWILPYARQLVRGIGQAGDLAQLIRGADGTVISGAITGLILK